MAVRGDDPLKIQQRAGHQTFDTTQRYIRMAEELRAGFGDPFPPLPEALGGGRPEGRRDQSSTKSPDAQKGPGFLGRSVGAAGIEPEGESASRATKLAAASQAHELESLQVTTVREALEHPAPAVGALTATELEATIAKLTRCMATAEDEDIAELVAERKSLRGELRALLDAEARASGKVTPIHDARRRGS